MRTGWRFGWAVMLLCVASCVQAGNPVYAVPDTDRARTDLAILLLPQSLDLEMVDGIAYPGAKSLFRKGETPVYVRPGEREIALRYNQFFQTTVNDHDIVKSKIIVLKFIAEPGKAYRAVHDNFRNASEARAAVENFVVKVQDDQGVNRVIAASQVQKNWKGESATTTRNDLVSAPAVAAAAALPASPLAASTVTGVAVAPAVTAPAAVPAPASPASGGLNAFELLKFTWQNASAADRAVFLEWVKANP